jgi:hypothetical protein
LTAAWEEDIIPRMSTRQAVALLSTMLMLWTGLVPCAPGQQPAPTPTQALQQAPIKQALIEIPAGSVVQVRLHDKQKLRGRLGPLTDSGFELQTVRDGKIQTQTLSFDQVRSVKPQGKGKSLTAKVAIGVVIGWGVVGAILACVAYCSDH